ncbi:Gfo/Idh/MocA family protein [Pseudocnuella soli]|uniref:Gfo/Idh/MocA family protein n=1 Tax=Pseudocnuella soli TaxID=2502779 RepID=UPI0019561866|nr:Gfo/Idh/MocA family oxidoreductase [Pseudocnuella soli]
MSQTMIRWGIIGCGDVTEVKSGPAFNKVPDSKLVAVMRRNADKAADYARRHGVDRWYSDAARLINDPEVNAVYIATPPLQHEEYTVAALRAGKPVYVEKPMAVSAAAAARMAQVAKETGLKLSVAHYRRAQPLYLKIKSLIAEGAIGVPRLVQLQCLQPHQGNLVAHTEEPWRYNPAISGGGLLHDLAPHQLDLMLHFFGAHEVASGYSFNGANLYPAADTTIGQAVFPGPVAFAGSWCFSAGQKRDECEIFGTEGSIKFSFFTHQPLVLNSGGGEQQFLFNPLPHVQQPMIQKVVDYFLDTSENPCSAEDGVTVMQMIEVMAGDKAVK